MRAVVGDPLTGTLPRTRLIVPQTVLGPARATPRLVWPMVPDPDTVTLTQLRPGRIAYVRRRRGVRRYQIRTITRSREPGRNRGRTFVTGHTRRGWIHTFWADTIVSTQTAAAALQRPPVSLRLVPVDWNTARGFVSTWHRHHTPPRGYLWAHGVANDDDVLVGVAIVGRPVSFVYDNGMTVEVTRTATDSTPNANSMLYGAVTRAAFAKGYRRVITYTQADESGASLRAAGYRIIAQRPARKGWSSPSRPRHDRGVDGIPRTLWEAV